MKRKTLFAVALCCCLIFSACSKTSEEIENQNSTETVSPPTYEKEDLAEKQENTIADDIGYRKTYARKDSIETARKVVSDIPKMLTQEELSGGEYLKVEFWYRCLKIELYSADDVKLSEGYCYPDADSANLSLVSHSELYEIYDENGDVYLRSTDLESHFFKYDDSGRIAEEEIVYNYLDTDYMAESIMDEISFDDDYAYIDDVSYSVYGALADIYDDIEHDYERLCYEYDAQDNVIREMLYWGVDEDSLYSVTEYTYEDGKLIQESCGEAHTDYEYDGDDVILVSSYSGNELYSTKTYSYNESGKIMMIFEEFTDSETENELSAIVYLN